MHEQIRSGACWRNKKLITVSAWRYDQKRMSCEICQEMKRQKGEVPDCDNCKGKVDLLPNNNIIEYLVNKYSTLLMDATGIKPEGIRLVLEIEADIIEDSQLVAQKLSIYLGSILRTLHKDRK